LRQLKAEIVAPKPHCANQSLARASCAHTGSVKLCDEIGVKCVLARLVELVHGPCLSKLLGKPRTRFGCGRCLSESGNHLKRRYRPVVASSRLGADAQCLLRGAQLCLVEAFGSDLSTDRQSSQSENIGDDAALDIEFHWRANVTQRKRRVWWQACLDHRRLGDAKLVVGRLQPFVVQKRDTNGRFHRQNGSE
jgi:hypothetical protein